MTRLARLTPRRLAALCATAATVALLPVVTAAGPVQAAAAACLTEAASFGQTRCDDVNPPETALISADPTVNRNGYIKQNHVTIGFSGSYTDADADAITYQCQFYDTAAAPTDWTACTSPASYTGLDDTTTDPYTFRVRAVDSGDNAIDATSGGLFGPTGAKTDLPDYDATPASASFFVDTSAPNTFVFDEPFDSITPDHPMVTQPDLTLDLESNESTASYACTVSGKGTPCTGNGEFTFRNLKPGNQVITVTTVDKAGNIDTTPTSTPFSVPRNLTPNLGTGWTQVTADGYFAGNYLSSTKAGSTLTVNAKKVKEMRVLAPKVAGLGTVQMRIGEQPPVILDQSSGKSTAMGIVFHMFFGRAKTAPITFTVLKASAKKPAILDAILLH